MKISNINITPLEGNGKTVAIASAMIENAIIVNSISVRKKEDDTLFVSLPQKKTSEGKYKDLAFPLSADGREKISTMVLDAYNNPQYKNTYNKDNAIPYDEKTDIKVNLTKVNDADSSVKAYGSATINGTFTVNNVKVLSGPGGVFMELPSYKKKDDSWQSIIVPASKEAYKALNDAVMKEYNTEYKFEKISAEKLEKLEKSGLEFRKGQTSENGYTTIKFNAENSEAIHTVMNANSAKRS